MPLLSCNSNNHTISMPFCSYRTLWLNGIDTKAQYIRKEPHSANIYKVSHLTTGVWTDGGPCSEAGWAWAISSFCICWGRKCHTPADSLRPLTQKSCWIACLNKYRLGRNVSLCLVIAKRGCNWISSIGPCKQSSYKWVLKSDLWVCGSEP